MKMKTTQTFRRKRIRCSRIWSSLFLTLLSVSLLLLSGCGSSSPEAETSRRVGKSGDDLNIIETREEVEYAVPERIFQHTATTTVPEYERSSEGNNDEGIFTSAAASGVWFVMTKGNTALGKLLVFNVGGKQ